MFQSILLITGFVEKSLIEELFKECAKMIEFDHPNVLKLSGVCVDGGPAPYIIMPLMVNGSLLAHLREKRSHLLLERTSLVDDDNVVSLHEQLVFTILGHRYS